MGCCVQQRRSDERDIQSRRTGTPVPARRRGPTCAEGWRALSAANRFVCVFVALILAIGASGSPAAGGPPGSGGGTTGGDKAAKGAPAAPTWSLDAMLATARQDLARGNFKRALAGAETVVRSNASASQRASALLMAGDAAFALRDYPRASGHYTAFLLSYPTLREAPRAAMARGWAKLRQGDIGHAQWAWSNVADEFPGDSHA